MGAGFVELGRRCQAVLEQNWIGHSTKPAPALYPHQWSWDSAFIAIGNARLHPDRACEELAQLFNAQWSNGMVPHIVFDGDTAGYFPSADLWGSKAIDASPANLATSGLCQPPVHATAVRRVAELVGDDRGIDLLRLLYEPLVGWHGYLASARTTTSALVEIWHPWESGMDNSPAWDSAMSALSLRAHERPPYQRVDTEHVAGEDRPSDHDYDRYMFLVEWLRQRDFQPLNASTVPFRVRDVLFNSLLVESERDLAWIARKIAGDPSIHDERAGALSSAISKELWSDQLGQHVSYDASADHPIEVPIAGSLVALTADPDPRHVRAIVESLLRDFHLPLANPSTPGAFIVPTVPIGHVRYEPTRYWRGPAWVNIMWLIANGLERVECDALATQLRAGIVDLVAANGCFEYFDPEQGHGRGSDSFSWTAALTLDLLDIKR